MANKIVIMPKKGKYVKFKNYERKRKSLLVIYANFKYDRRKQILQ